MENKTLLANLREMVENLLVNIGIMSPKKNVKTMISGFSSGERIR